VSEPTLDDLRPCFTGVIPMIFATASAAGVPNVTYLSRALPLDHERIALSNQFMSKSHRNLAENPRGCIQLVHPDTHAEFRIWVTFERTERQGPVFDRMRNELSMIAALTRMQDVFRLAAADIYRVERIDQVVVNQQTYDPLPPAEAVQPDHLAIGELCARLSRAGDLDTLVDVLVQGLDDLLGYSHSMLLLADETGERLFTIASHGYEREGVGSEVTVGDGLVGLAAERCTPMHVQNLAQVRRYARQVREGFERTGALDPGTEIPLPGLASPGSQMAAPALTLGQFVGALLVESPRSAAFSDADVTNLSIVAALVASVVERLRHEAAAASAPAVPGSTPPPAAATDRPVVVRHYAADGSTFVDDEYLIKGVAGKLLWSLLRQYEASGRTDFTNREMRLDPTLELPDFRDNFESRLILLKRRLDERGAPLRIHKSGRGRFRLEVTRPLDLVAPDPGGAG
jgi:predicted pyridoxine 5'-phosphate oxidase superfamily flavin-nucleotide-binding protein